MKNTIKLLALSCVTTVMLTACANENVTPAVNNSTPKETPSSVVTASNGVQSETDNKNSSTALPPSSEEVSTGIVEYGICDVWKDEAGISYKDIMGVTGYSGTPVNVEIPETYEGKPIEGIKALAFEDCTSLESVSMPDSVKAIGSYAFECCYSIKSITISNNVTYIGDGAFQGCTSLESITIPDKVVYIGYQAFDYCTNLKSVEIPNSVNILGEGAFGDCSNLESVTIGSGVTAIERFTFIGCPNLKSLTLPDTLESISTAVFGDTNCTKIQVTYKGNIYDYAHIEDLYKAVNGE